jgi:Na+/H+-translocating membrane pyrophosphatase
MNINIKEEEKTEAEESLKERNIAALSDIGCKISQGAQAFLKAQYRVMTSFVIAFSAIVLLLMDYYDQEHNRKISMYATIS